MDLRYQRNLEVNEWIITTRWFYMVAIFLVGIIGNSLINLLKIEYSLISIVLLLIAIILVNAYFYKFLIKIKKNQSEKKLKYLSMAQIGLELISFTLIIFVGGDESITSVFFFLPILSAAVIFGVKGAVITAVLAGLLVNISAVTDYYFYFSENVANKQIFNLLELSEFRHQTVNMITIIVTANFYLILAVFSGYGFKFMYSRERVLMSQAEEMQKVSEYSENERRQLETTTKLLVNRDLELTETNKKLDQKIEELERSEKSMLKAFMDLKRERKQTEKERKKTTAIISNFIDPIIVMDKNHKINLLNPAAKDIFGFLDSDLGKEVGIKNKYSMENFKKLIKQDYEVKTIKNTGSKNMPEEEILINIDGQDLTYKAITAAVLSDNNEILGTMKIFYNLTREKMIDKLKSEFISIAAHQLRTPLSAIKWVIKMVIDGDTGKLNEEQYKLLKKGYDSNERIIDLVNDMLNVSRIEEGRFGYNFKKEKIEDVIELVVDGQESIIEKKHIKFIFNKPKKLPLVLMDSSKMSLAVQNVIENAIKYTPEHGKITVSLESGNKFLTVKVKDNGVGIPEADKEKLFSKFFRAANVIRMQAEGSGLGLFIVKNIIKKHGGEITYNSEEGKGTEFVFTIPHV